MIFPGNFVVIAFLVATGERISMYIINSLLQRLLENKCTTCYQTDGEIREVFTAHSLL